MAKRTAQDVVRDLVKAASVGEVAGDFVMNTLGFGPQGDQEPAQKQFVNAAGQMAQNAGSLVPIAQKIKENPNAQRGLNEGLQERARSIPIVGGMF